MNSSVNSPFLYHKWEDEKDHFIWLPPEFSEWEGKKSIYILGSRGTGKTTLLQGFVYSQRFKNESLRQQLKGEDPFKKGYIGIYLSMPDYITSQFSEWPPIKPDQNNEQWQEETARLFSLYIEYGALELFIKAIQELQVKKILNFTPETEFEFTKKILEERFELKVHFIQKENAVTLNDLRLVFKRLHENIRACAINRIELEPEENYPKLQMGQMLEEISKLLIDLCSEHDKETNKNERWSLKICIDQAESLEHYQQRAINTIVGRKNLDVSFIVAAVGGFIDSSSTFIPKHSLTDADRAIYKLDDVYSNNKKFYEFISAVVNLRIQKALQKKDAKIDLKELLGIWDINTLLDPSLKKSESDVVIDFRKNAEIFSVIWNQYLQNQKIVTDIEDDDDNDDEIEFISNITKSTSYLEYYLLKKLNNDLPLDLTNTDEFKKIKFGYFRKMRVASVLCLCEEFSFKVPYAGHPMVIKLSDGCIRDFLKIMHEIYREQDLSTKNFIKKQIPKDTQQKAIYLASKKKFDSIITEIPYYCTEVSNLVEATGRITSLVQSNYKERSTFVTPEKGKFILDYTEKINQKDKNELREIINLTREIFCLKVVDERGPDDDRKKITYRLPRLFAPHFKFSYRGPYKENKISINDLMHLCKEFDEKERNILINSIVRKIIKIHTIIEKEFKETKLDRWLE